MTTPERPDPAALRRLLAAGTEGPWAVREEWWIPVAIVRRDGADEEVVIGGISCAGSPGRLSANAALIVAAVNALPALLDRLEAMEDSSNGV